MAISGFSSYWPEYYQNDICKEFFLYWFLFYIIIVNSVPNFKLITSFFSQLRILQFFKISQKEIWILTGSAIMKFWIFKKYIFLTLNTCLFVSNYRKQNSKSLFLKSSRPFWKYNLFSSISVNFSAFSKLFVTSSPK